MRQPHRDPGWAESARSDRIDRGFTLVELLVVVVILGVLAGIVVFAVGSTTTNSAQAACKADAKSLETALEAYKAQFGSYPGPTPGFDPTNISYYSTLTTTANGGPWLRQAPSAAHYEIWFNNSGQVYVTASGTTVDPHDNTATNDFDNTSPNVCTTGVVH